jgi:hypothetical protein
MDKELQRYYEDRFALMSSQAWKDLIDDVKEMKEAINQVGNITSTEDLWFKKGEISIMDWLLSLENVSKEAYDVLQGEE